MQLSAAVRAALQKKEDSDQTGAQLVPAANISDDPVRSEFSAAVRAALQKKEDSDQTGAQLVPAANISDDPVRSDFLRSLQHSTVAAASSSDRGVEQSRRKVCFGFAALRNAVGGAIHIDMLSGMHRTSKMRGLATDQPTGGRRSYEFLGQTIAPDCLASLLGIGKKRLLKSDDESDDADDDHNDAAVILPPEQLQLDADLKQEMEMDRELWNKHVGTVFGLDMEKLPRYNLFQARFQQKWSTKLVFRSATDFAECDQCWSLKEGIRQAQAENCFSGNTPVLFVQTDGMDQAKWSVPSLVEAVSEYLLSERISVTRADAIYGLLATAFRYLTELVDPEDVCAKWLELAEIIMRQYPTITPELQRSIIYLTRVSRGEAPAPSLEPLPWHEQVKPADVVQGIDSLAACGMLLPVATFRATLDDHVDLSVAVASLIAGSVVRSMEERESRLRRRLKPKPPVPLFQQRVKAKAKDRRRFPKGYFGTRDLARMMDARLISLQRVIRSCVELSVSKSAAAAHLLTRVEKLLTKHERLEMSAEDRC
ncbi:hypothetical protein AK812_SmicGene34281 [Symbiodinium microadriaticum]|uniref:Uncharacterized protein n=1 Tax=Symbiodinium microadriaticum TaxID=2951 RepID=A0A1Q9CPF3_SYMMI|nr:hypothetical protein AK812_SmicGene34281 [Symbiodinium microadriaticum]CAE7762068.1 unnamed protein product [Symbiodinium sp. KB8]CAE7785207.1 unnamed protein product [Symbiodinium microadriaticum]